MHDALPMGLPMGLIHKITDIRYKILLECTNNKSLLIKASTAKRNVILSVCENKIVRE